MEVIIQSIKFDATEQLNQYVNKKVSKLEKFFERTVKAEVYLKVTKPETASNKEAEIILNVPNKRLFASKTADTFEQAIDECITALMKQLEKNKNNA